MQIPLWVIASLGKPVELVSSFFGPSETYPPMHQGVLRGILYNEDSKGCYVIVALDVNDPTYLENFGFSEIRPPLSKPVPFDITSDQNSVAF